MSVPSQDPYRDNRKRGAQDNRVFMNSKKFKESKDGQEKVPTLLLEFRAREIYVVAVNISTQQALTVAF